MKYARIFAWLNKPGNERDNKYLADWSVSIDGRERVLV